jgi:hypothetical protein
MMCGFVSLVAPDALHTGNGCPHDQGPASAHVVVPPAPGADPAWYTEDELWYDAWGLPSLARPPADVAYGVASYVATRAGKESEIPNFKGSYLGRFPLVSADFWTSDHLSERSRSMDAFSGTRARGTLTLKRT